MTDRLQLGARRFAGRVWRLTHPYWSRSDERPVAWALLIAIVSMSMGIVYMAVWLNSWNREFYNSLEQKNYADFLRLLTAYCGIAAAAIVVAVFRAYLRQMLQMRWRIWLTRQYLGEWLDDQVYYRLEQDPRGTDNPDQRISADLQAFTNATLALTLDLLQQVVTIVSFVIILWNVSGPLDVTLFGREFVIPGYMVWAAVAYAIVGSVITYYVGRPLIGLNFQQERREADLRFALMRLREHAEGVALYRGEKAEHAQLAGHIERIRVNWWDIMRATLRLNFLTNTYDRIALVFPFFVAAPRYFSGAMPLGGLTQIAGAFDTVQSSLSWFVQTYASLASWKASVDRLLTFHDAVHAATREAREHRGVRIEPGPAGTIAAEGVDIALPGGREILHGAAFEIRRGERVLVSGPSGSGKSTLFRAIAGLWAYGRGKVRVPPDERVLFLPQKAYIPVGTLRDGLTYPEPAGAYDDATIHEALAIVGLGGFVPRLDESANWNHVMSGGEQQKVAFARALLTRPRWLFLDEASASLDEETEARLYGLLRERLPDTTIVSIAHRSQVARFHDRRLRFDSGHLVGAPIGG